MSKTGKKSVLTRIVTGTVVTACAASAIWAAGGSVAPYAKRAELGTTARAAVTQMLAQEQTEAAVKVEGLYTQLQILGENNYGINLMLAVSGEGKAGGVDASANNMRNVLINGKPMWGGGVYFNWNVYWGAPDNPSTLNGFVNLDGSAYTETFDSSLNVIMINGSSAALNFSHEGNDVITLTKDFELTLPTTAEKVTLGEEMSFRAIMHKNDQNEVDGIAWERIDSRIVTTQDEVLFAAGDDTHDGAQWVHGGIVDTTYDGNTNPDSVTVRTNDAGHINLLNADEDAIDISTDAGWKPSGGLYQVKMQRALSFWVYTTIDRTKFTGLNNAIGLSSYDYSADTDSKEFRWNATDVFADSSTLTVGKWNHIVLRLGEAAFNAMNDENAQDQLRYAAMKYFRMYWVTAEGLPVEDLAKDDGIYFSDFHLLETPSQTQIGYETAKVKQFVEPTFEKPTVGGGKVEIDLGLTTRLLNTPGVGEDKITLASSDPETIKVEKDTDGKWYATALKTGSATVTATIPGDDRYAASEQEFNMEARKADQAAITVTSAATGTYGTEYRLTSAGGSGEGTVAYEIVSGDATLDGDKLKFGKAGTVVVKALKAADATYEAAESEEFTITVAKAKITVTIGNQNVEQNTVLPPAYSYTVTEGTLLTGDSIKLNYSTDADITKAGEYDITATADANDKYDITIIKGKLTINAVGGNDGDKKKGCNSAIGAGSAIAGIAALAAATGIMIARKRKKED